MCSHLAASLKKQVRFSDATGLLFLPSDEDAYGPADFESDWSSAVARALRSCNSQERVQGGLPQHASAVNASAGGAMSTRNDTAESATGDASECIDTRGNTSEADVNSTFRDFARLVENDVVMLAATLTSVP